MSYGYTFGPSVATIVWCVLSVVFAIAGGILVYILFVNTKKDKKLSPKMQWLKEFLNFDKMLVESIIKVVYLITTILVILLSFSFISSSFVSFLLMLIIGPVVVRIAYELILIRICIWKNTTEIAKKVK